MHRPFGIKPNIAALALLLLISISLYGNENVLKESRPFQITLIEPVGMNSPLYVNNVSLNILYGFNGGVEGAEFGLLMNHNEGEVTGFQLAGGANYTKGTTTGAVVAGIFNYTKENFRGFQLAPVNITAGTFKGFQLGFVNTADELEGIQLGVVNYAGKAGSGISFGLFSIYKNGLFELETAGSEVLYLNLNYRMGLDRFYKVFKTGFSQYRGKPVQSFGVGFGRYFDLKDNHKVSLEVSGNQILYDYRWSDSLNILFKADISYQHSFDSGLALSVGPSLNVYMTSYSENGKYGTLNIPYTIFTKEISGGKQFYWIGMNAGISYKF